MLWSANNNRLNFTFSFTYCKSYSCLSFISSSTFLMVKNTGDNGYVLGEFLNISLLNMMLACVFLMLKKLHQVWIFNFYSVSFQHLCRYDFSPLIFSMINYNNWFLNIFNRFCFLSMNFTFHGVVFV